MDWGNIIDALIDAATPEDKSKSISIIWLYVVLFIPFLMIIYAIWLYFGGMAILPSLPTPPPDIHNNL